MRIAIALAGLGLAVLTAGCVQDSQYPTYGYSSGYPGYAYNAGYPRSGYSTGYPGYGYNAGYPGYAYNAGAPTYNAGYASAGPVGPAAPPGTRVFTTDGSGQVGSTGTYYGPGNVVADPR